MEPNHLWNRLVNISGDLLSDYRSVQLYIQQVINTGTTQQLGVNRLGQIIIQYSATINGE